jgi:hypothetical protein
VGTFVNAPGAACRVVLIGATEGKETGHWAVLAARRATADGATLARASLLR